MIARRLISAVPLLLVVSFGVFCMELLIPGDVAYNLAGQYATPGQIVAIRRSLHLNDPLPQRFGEWVWHALHGDLGHSLFTGQSVASAIASHWRITASLMAGALLLALAVSVPLAVYAASHQHGVLDRVMTAVTSVGIGVPEFVLGILLIDLLAVQLRWLPVAGYAGGWSRPGLWLSHMIIPISCLSVNIIATLFRQLRSDLAEVLSEDYMRTAHAKGLRWRQVVLKHGLRAAAAPSVSILGVQIPRLMGGTFVIEAIFALPGLGLLTVGATLNKDLPVIQGVVPLLVAVAISGNLIADVTNMLLNPRLRASTS